MTGLLICVFLIMGSMAVWADQTGAVSGQTRVFDQAGLFSETEKIQLEEEIAQCRKNTKIDVDVVSAYADDRTAEENADDYYDYGGFGVGKKASGVLLLYYMDGPGQSGGECYISTSGTMITLLTDERIETILDDVYGNLGNRDFAAASQIFLEDVSDYVHTHRACQNTGDHNRCHCLIPADTAVTDDFPGITVISILTRLHSLFHIVTYIFQKNLGSCRDRKSVV